VRSLGVNLFLGCLFFLGSKVCYTQTTKNQSGFWSYPANQSRAFLNFGGIGMLNYFRFDLPKYGIKIAPTFDMGVMINAVTGFQVGLSGYRIKRNLSDAKLSTNTLFYEFPFRLKLIVPTKQFRFVPYALVGLSFCYSDFKYDTTKVKIESQFKKHDTYLVVSFGASEKLRSRLWWYYELGFKHSMGSLFSNESSFINFRTNLNYSIGFSYRF